MLAYIVFLEPQGGGIQIFKAAHILCRKAPQERVYPEDQLKLFEKQDKIESFDDIDSALTPPGYTFQKYDNHVVFYHF